MVMAIGDGRQVVYQLATGLPQWGIPDSPLQALQRASWMHRGLLHLATPDISMLLRPPQACLRQGILNTMHLLMVLKEDGCG